MFTIDLLPGEETLGGKVVDEQGRPIASVTVIIWGHLGEQREALELAYMVTAKTDAHGLWRCRCFRRMKFVHLFLLHDGYVGDYDGHRRSAELAAVRDFSDVQVMNRGVALT